MTKNINVGDIQLNNSTVRESIMIVERAISEQGFVAMEEVTLHTLLMAGDDERASEGLRELDHTVIADVGILQAAKQGTMQRKFEIEDHTFFFELMKRLERNSKKVFLLGANADEITAKKKFILEKFPKLEIVGCGSVEDCVGNDEALVNNINSVSPDVIVSLLRAPFQEVFLLEHKGKMSASFWYGMGEIDPEEERIGLFERLKRWRQRKELEKAIWAH